MLEQSSAERDEFPEEVVEDVDGLLWLGYLEDVIDYCGHEFVIRTLRAEDQLLAAIVTKDYTNTLGQARAWIAAHVGLALVSVDGDEDFCPPAGFNKRDFAKARFNYVTSKWFEPTISRIYDSYAELLERQAVVLEEMENLSQKSLTTFMDLPDSLNQKEDSQTVQEITDLLNEDE